MKRLTDTAFAPLAATVEALLLAAPVVVSPTRG
jgi:hypothetical protein